MGRGHLVMWLLLWFFHSDASKTLLVHCLPGQSTHSADFRMNTKGGYEEKM
jgi:hypothetical protein